MAGFAETFRRRTPLYRVLDREAVRWSKVGDAAIADPRDHAGAAGRLGLADLTPLPRLGFKGRGTIAAMQARGVTVEAVPNRAFRQADGGLCLVLAPGEVILLSNPAGDGTRLAELEAEWRIEAEERTYPVPRHDSHAWLAVTGREAPGFFARLCGVDLRLERFADLSIAQTSLARLNAIITRADLGTTPAFHVLADSASAAYLLECLRDAAEEFGGRLVGLSVLRGPAGIMVKRAEAGTAGGRQTADAAEPRLGATRRAGPPTAASNDAIPGESQFPDAFPTRNFPTVPALPAQDPHALEGARDNILEVAIGREVRAFRNKLGITVSDLAAATGLSLGMLSKIENGVTSPSLTTLQLLSRALGVPVTAFFRRYEERRDAVFVKSGEGLAIERRGTRAGHQYHLLGHTGGNTGRVVVEPYMITLTEESDVFPLFQHSGLEFLYVLEGEVVYRHADKLYTMRAGDSLFFDADAPHGPEEMRQLPIRFLSIISYPRDDA